MKPIKIIFIPIIVSIFFLTSNPLVAQPKIKGLLISPKLGLFATSNESDISGIALAFEAGLQFENNSLISVTLLNATEILGSSKMNALNFTYGRWVGNEFIRMQVQGGLGMLWLEDSYQYSQDKFTLGVPLNLSMKVMPLSFFGIGLNFNMNFNPQNTFYIPMLSLEIGNLR